MRSHHHILLSVFLIASFFGTGLSQWSKSGLPGKHIGALLATGDTVLAGHNDGVYVSPDRGATWDSLARLSTLAVSAFLSIADTFLVTTERERGCDVDTCEPLPSIFRSTNGGAVWDPVHDAIYGATEIQRTSGGFYSNPDGLLHRSADGGKTWDFVPFDTASFGAVRFLFAYDDTLYIDTQKGGFLRSADHALTWSMVTGGLPDAAIFGMVEAGNILFAVPATFGVYRSADNGRTWDAINGGLHQYGGIHTLLAIGPHLIAASTDSVYYFPPTGAVWRNISENLQPQGLRFISSLAANDEFLLAGTNDGVWRRPLTDFTTSVSTDRMATSLVVSPNYPNPFNEMTTIDLVVATPSVVTVKVFDILGQEVATLLHEALPAGRHNTILPTEGLSSGAYIYRLTAVSLHSGESQVLEQKLVLTK